MPEYSVSPTGEKFALPTKQDYAVEFTQLQELAAAAHKEGKEVVVVKGVGFCRGSDGSDRGRYGA